MNVYKLNTFCLRLNTFFNQHGGFNVKRYKILLLLLFVAILPHTYAVDTVEGYFHPGGMYGGYTGYYTYYDYCPMCHHHDCLLLNPKGTYEGEITCAVCDADYDGCTGYDKHGGGARARLERYYEPEPEPSVLENTTTNMTTNTTTLTGWDLAHHTYKNNQII